MQGGPDAAFLEQMTTLEGTRPAQWRVVWTEQPATRATVSWSTAEAGSEHRVRYGPLPAPEDGTQL